MADQKTCPTGARCANPWQMMTIDVTGSVYPCPYYHFSADAPEIGNTNTHSVEEIWNGPGYRDLRARHASGDLEGHPCHQCMGWKAIGGYPAFEWGGGFRLDSGHCYLANIPEQFWERVRDRASEVVVTEDGAPLPHPEMRHAEIREHGRGRYSVWHGVLFLAASDNTNPATNGRRYELRLGDDVAVIDSLTADTPAWTNTHIAHREFQAGAIEVTATPAKLTFIENADCNIDCPACSQNEVRRLRIGHRPETSPSVLAMSRAAQELIWHGGEPYLMPHFRKFVSDYTPDFNPDLSFGFMTNSTMLTETQAKRLENFDRFNVTISIDSFVPETYAKMRAGANFDAVLASLHRLLALQDHPRRKVTVATITGKSNVVDLPFNIRYAMDRNIRLMINPILAYPPTEKLNLYRDFSEQTVGWEEALSESEQLLAQAQQARSRFLNGLNCEALVKIIRDVFDEQKALHSDTVEIELHLRDTHGSLGEMRAPGIIICPWGGGPGNAVSYAEVPRDGSPVRIKAPRQLITGRMAVSLYPDIFDLRSDGGLPAWKIDPRDIRSGRVELSMRVPRYVAPPRPANILYVKRDRENDYRIDQNITIMDAFQAIQQQEHNAGFGFVGRRGVGSPRSEDASGQGWRGFLVNYFRPFNANETVRRQTHDTPPDQPL